MLSQWLRSPKTTTATEAADPIGIAKGGDHLKR
jgi:hypothetical protein